MNRTSIVVWQWSMSTQLPLRCKCGKVRGVARKVSPKTGSRVVCYCDDCQAFAHFLDRGDVLDAHGGTDIFQLPPSEVEITQGAELVRCLRLSDKGLFRFYTECCHTPMGNMVGPWLPFVGMIDAFMDHEGDGRSRDEVLGKPVARILGKFAKGGMPSGAHPKTPKRFLLRIMRLLAVWWIKGRKKPSPFFDARTKAPRGELRVLSVGEREELRARCGG